MDAYRSDDVSRWPFVLIVIGGLVALFGTYWDDVWHTDYGRDDFFIPPHLMIYSGVTLMGAAASLWGWLLYLRTRSLRAVVMRPSLAMMLLGVVATLLAAPIDEFWHAAFGRDAVVWSPPHMVGVMALFALACGVFLETLKIPGPVGALLTVTAGAFLLGVLHVPVMEYESDVPQFAVLWYLPILAGTTALALSIAETRARLRWIATLAALVYTAMRTAVLVFLLALEHSAVLVSPIILPALVFDLTRGRGYSLTTRAGAYTGAMFAVYVPFLNVLHAGVYIPLADAVLGLAIAALAVLAVLVLMSARRARPAAVLGAVGLLAVLIPQDAFAHDPGQGLEVGTAHFTVSPLAEGVEVFVELNTTAGVGCEGVRPISLVARRAGRDRSAPLTHVEGCRYHGSIELPERGRWFVYTEFDHAGTPVESWAPVVQGALTQPLRRISSAYIPPQRADEYSAVQIATGVVLYLISLLFVVSAVWAVRRAETAESAEIERGTDVR